MPRFAWTWRQILGGNLLHFLHPKFLKIPPINRKVQFFETRISIGLIFEKTKIIVFSLFCKRFFYENGWKTKNKVRINLNRKLPFKTGTTNFIEVKNQSNLFLTLLSKMKILILDYLNFYEICRFKLDFWWVVIGLDSLRTYSSAGAVSPAGRVPSYITPFIPLHRINLWTMERRL